MIKMYYRGVHVSIIVYDVSDRSSFESVSDWLNDVREKQLNKRILKNAKPTSNQVECMYYVIGNKSDLDDQRQVSTQEGVDFVRNLQEEINEEGDGPPPTVVFMEVSAKTGQNINEVFSDITEKLSKRFDINKMRNMTMKKERLSFDYDQ